MARSETSTFRRQRPLALAVLLALAAPGMAQADNRPRRYGIGEPVREADIAAWDIDVGPDGTGLPPGRGSVSQGQTLYASRCSGCHGERGQGGIGPRLVGGLGTLATPQPVKTIGSFWPYATTVFDYVYRAMPYPSPQSLTPAELYGVTSYLLYLNGIVPADTVLDARSLPAVLMPNRNGFVSDPRPDVGRRRD
jgi:cytochrome c